MCVELELRVRRKLCPTVAYTVHDYENQVKAGGVAQW